MIFTRETTSPGARLISRQITDPSRRLTKDEVAELKTLRAPPPKPPAPPCAPAITIEPDFFEVLTISGCNGHDLLKAREQVLARTRGYVERMKTICPEAYAGVLSARVCIAETTALHHRVVNGSIGAICQIESLLRARGEALRAAEAHRGVLKDAQARLESPNVLDLLPEEAFRLNNLSHHMPAKVAEAEATAGQLEGEIRRLVEDHKIALAALVSSMVHGARNERRAIVDQQIISLESSGYLSLPEIPIADVTDAPEVTALNSESHLNLAP